MATLVSPCPGSIRFRAGIGFLGIPFVLAYSAAIFWVFRGKVRLGHSSY